MRFPIIVYKDDPDEIRLSEWQVAQPSRRFRTSGRPTLSFLEGRGFAFGLEWVRWLRN